MEVILLEKIRNVGNLGDRVKVKPGFGRNYLLPQRKAVSATKTNLEKFESRRSELEAKAGETLHVAQARAAKLAELSQISMAAKVIDEGKLYGSVGIVDIAEALQKLGVEVAKSEIKLPSGPIRHIGEYDIDLLLHSDVTATIKIVITPEQ
jgi:large subunit ribosomal protein L9